MSAGGPPSVSRVLDPMDRISEVLFGLIMVLTFTGTLSAASAGRDEVRTMLIGAIGCNLAWGLVDAAMYLMARFAERGRDLLTFRTVRQATDEAAAHDGIIDALPPVVASVLTRAELSSIRQRVRALPEPPEHHRLTRHDYAGALGVFLLVFLSTFPVVIPFLFMQDTRLAMRTSNGVALLMLFLTGAALGRLAGRQPLRTGLVMVLVGVVLVGLTIALGG
jgi:hypothetical protein